MKKITTILSTTALLSLAMTSLAFAQGTSATQEGTKTMPIHQEMMRTASSTHKGNMASAMRNQHEGTGSSTMKHMIPKGKELSDMASSTHKEMTKHATSSMMMLKKDAKKQHHMKKTAKETTRKEVKATTTPVTQ